MREEKQRKIVGMRERERKFETQTQYLRRHSRETGQTSNRIRGKASGLYYKHILTIVSDDCK
jgi:hypothetical protein